MYPTLTYICIKFKSWIVLNLNYGEKKDNFLTLIILRKTFLSYF